VNQLEEIVTRLDVAAPPGPQQQRPLSDVCRCHLLGPLELSAVGKVHVKVTPLRTKPASDALSSRSAR